MLKNILLAFIPIFVAVDAIGVLPIFVALTAGAEPETKKRIIVQSMATALGLAIGFVLLGKAVFRLLGITVSDFMIAGGAILFSLAIIDIINPVKRRRMSDEQLGVVPLGTPLLVGPAVLTTCLLVIPQHGMLATVVAVAANILLAGLVLKSCDGLIRMLGEAGTRALSKVTSLLLAAIAVMLIRKGVFMLLEAGKI
jgi:multiple antibiotic resistance protein